MKVLKNVRKDSTRKVRSDLLCVVKLTRRSVIFSEMPKQSAYAQPDGLSHAIRNKCTLIYCLRDIKR